MRGWMRPSKGAWRATTTVFKDIRITRTDTGKTNLKGARILAAMDRDVLLARVASLRVARVPSAGERSMPGVRVVVALTLVAGGGRRLVAPFASTARDRS